MSTTSTNGKELLAITREEGVADLPMAVRASFAKALQAERNGDDQAAADYLAKAILAEAKALATV